MHERKAKCGDDVQRVPAELFAETCRDQRRNGETQGVHGQPNRRLELRTVEVRDHALEAHVVRRRVRSGKGGKEYRAQGDRPFPLRREINGVARVVLLELDL